MKPEYIEFLRYAGETVEKAMQHGYGGLSPKDSHKLLSFVEVCLSELRPEKQQEVLEKLNNIAKW